MNTSFDIGGRAVGPGHPTFVIAELSANHAQRFERAVELVRAAHAAGADAIKLQTYTADTLTVKCDAPPFRIQGTLWDGRLLHDLYQEAHMPWEWQPKLKAVADDLGLPLFSTPFDPTAVDFLEDMGVPAHKIASFEIVNLPLIRRVAQTGKPIIMSTGMASVEEIEAAVSTVRAAGPAPLALLKCTSAYPARPDEMNLRTIPDLARRFDVPAGLSDHTMGSVVAVAAVALGACIVEKHFTLARSEGGPDSAFSMEPAEFRDMVQDIRMAEQSLGGVRYQPDAEEEKSLRFRRSLFVVQTVRKGERFTAENVRSIRPADGLPPKHYDAVLGRLATRDLARGTPLAWDMVEGGGP
jgi:pseudaminic acid synthase